MARQTRLIDGRERMDLIDSFPSIFTNDVLAHIDSDMMMRWRRMKTKRGRVHVGLEFWL